MVDPAALDLLTPEQKEACLLAYGEGMSQAEVASALGVRQAAISRRIARANEALARHGYPRFARRRAHVTSDRRSLPASAA
jgi:DNA-directed RNA polymerase specialized sigma24 family protein